MKSRCQFDGSSSLPPMFRLHTIGEAVRLVRERNTADQTAKAVRPVSIRNEGAQHRTIEELSSRSDLWCDGDLSKPAVVLTSTAMGVIKASFDRERHVLCEKHLRTRAKRHPLIPTVLRYSVSCSLVDEDGHDREFLIGLDQHLLRRQ